MPLYCKYNSPVYTKICFLLRMPYYGRILKYTYSNILLASLARERQNKNQKFKKRTLPSRTFFKEHSIKNKTTTNNTTQYVSNTHDYTL